MSTPEMTDPEKPAASGEKAFEKWMRVVNRDLGPKESYCAGYNAGVEAERAEHFSNPAEKIITDLRAECEMLRRTEKALRARVDELEKLHEHDDECSRAMVECAAEWSTRLAAAEAERDRLREALKGIAKASRGMHYNYLSPGVKEALAAAEKALEGK